MRIAFLSFYSGIRERGVEVWVSELSKRLIKNHEIFIYQVGCEIKDNLTRHTPIEVDWERKSLKGIIRRLYLDYYSRKIFSFTRKALEKTEKENIDLLIPVNGGWQTMLCRLYATINKKKIIVVGHSGIGWDDFINLMVRPDFFIALTNYQKAWAKRFGFGVKVEKIPDGVNLEEFTPEGEIKKLTLQRPIILIVSALSPGKHVDLAIKAVSRLNRGSLVVLGSGTLEETNYVENLGKKLLGERFLLSAVPHNETPQWYRACNLITFPSWKREAFGMVLLEAMACNKPVVAAADPAKQEIVGEAGFFCNPSNISDYAKTLIMALNYKFGNIPRRQAEKYSWDNIVFQYEKLFKSL